MDTKLNMQAATTTESLINFHVLKVMQDLSDHDTNVAVDLNRIFDLVQSRIRKKNKIEDLMARVENALAALQEFGVIESVGQYSFRLLVEKGQPVTGVDMNVCESSSEDSDPNWVQAYLLRFAQTESTLTMRSTDSSIYMRESEYLITYRLRMENTESMMTIRSTASEISISNNTEY